MAETFQSLHTPVCRVITDLAARRELHRRKRLTSQQAVTEDLKDSLRLMTDQTEINRVELERDKQLVMDAINRLAKRTSEAMAQSFVSNVLLERSRR